MKNMKKINNNDEEYKCIDEFLKTMCYNYFEFVLLDNKWKTKGNNKQTITSFHNIYQEWSSNNKYKSIGIKNFKFMLETVFIPCIDNIDKVYINIPRKNNNRPYLTRSNNNSYCYWPYITKEIFHEYYIIHNCPKTIKINIENKIQLKECRYQSIFNSYKKEQIKVGNIKKYITKLCKNELLSYEDGKTILNYPNKDNLKKILNLYYYNFVCSESYINNILSLCELFNDIVNILHEATDISNGKINYIVIIKDHIHYHLKYTLPSENYNQININQLIYNKIKFEYNYSKKCIIDKNNFNTVLNINDAFIFDISNIPNKSNIIIRLTNIINKIKLNINYFLSTLNNKINLIETIDYSFLN